MKLFLITIYLSVSLYAFPQFFSEKMINVEHIGINNGLSQGMINSIFQDHIGFMWFGTLDGLNRYDGYSFKVFRNDHADTTSISGNFITSILEDSKGRLWIGTALNGLNLFNRETEQFTHFTTNSKPSLSNNSVFSIQEDRNGAIWIGTQLGLNKLTTENEAPKKKSSARKIYEPKSATIFKIKLIPLTDPSGKELFVTNQNYEPAFYITKCGMIWGTASGSVFKILPAKSGMDKIIKEDMSVYSIPLKGSKGYGSIIKIAEDTATGMLCLKGENFFTVINQRNGTTSHWKFAAFDLNMSRNQVIFENGILWERTSKGLFCFDLLQKKMFHVNSSNSEFAKILRIPFSIYKDRSGIIWIGTGGLGLLKYNPHTEAFHKITGASVTSMSTTPTGSVLLISEGIKYYSRDSSFTNFEYIADTAFNEKLQHYTALTPDVALQDNDGVYWLNIDGLVKLNLQKKTIATFKNKKDILFPFFLDKTDRFWFADSHSFCLFNKTTYNITSFRFPVAATVANPYRFCQVIYQDTRGIFWLGTTEGLFSFNETTKEWRHYKHIPADITSISNNVVFTICEEPSNPGEYIWAGTNGGGLNRLCISTGKFEHIGTKEGLPNMVVYGILADEDKQLWMSTNNGIASLTLKYKFSETGKAGKIAEKKFKYYFEENGLQSNEFNRYAYCKTKDGTMFFGGVNGFNYFNPRKVTSNNTVPTVIITDLKIGNKPVSFQSEEKQGNKDYQQVLSKPIFLTASIDLPHSANMVSFDFASLDFTSPEKNQYRYKLENFDKEWIQSGNTHSATYTNLDPGKYTFLVRGSNSDGIWNQQGTSIKLTILTPWYKSWWYKITLFTACIAWLFLFFRYRLQQKIKLYKIRNSISSDLHDEIGSTLSSVYIYSDVAQKTLNDKDSKIHAYLKIIGTDAGSMIDALNDIIWTVNPKNDRFENIINRMRASAIEIFEAKGYNLHLKFDEKLNSLKLAMEKRKNFYLLFKEAVNNTSKYADGKNVWITLTNVKSKIHLLIQDDGQGFRIDNKPSGNGIANMQKRAALLKGTFEIISSPEKGTLVQLMFPI